MVTISTIKHALYTASSSSLQEGTLTRQQYRQVAKIINHPRQVKPDGTPVDLHYEIRNYVSSNLAKIDWKTTWANIVKWIKEHWLLIFQFVLGLIPLLFIDLPKEL